MTTAQKITIETTVAANAAQAWNSYTQPQHMTQWNFANDDWCCPRAENDVRVGGMLNARMEAKDGSFGFDFGGTYSEVLPHEKLAYTLGDGREVLIVFTENNGQTHVKITFDAEQQNPADMQRAGWQAILDNYKKHTETIA
ncbi:activator of HSP90 ATPase [bacterium]|nr:activator of HSP90 ATPase [bacterium]